MKKQGWNFLRFYVGSDPLFHETDPRIRIHIHTTDLDREHRCLPNIPIGPQKDLEI